MIFVYSQMEYHSWPPISLGAFILTNDLPPSRKSIFATGDIKCFGPHQRFTSSGSTQTCQTISTGALNIRVTSTCLAILMDYIIRVICIFSQPYAFFNASISNFLIFINACTTRGAFLGSDISSPNIVGTTCHDNPNLSLHHPHILSSPPSAISLYQ